MVNTKTTLSKKVLAIVLAVACMVAFTPAIAFTQSANAASKLKVSPTKATVYVAKTKTIKAKGLSKKHLKKVKWTTSKKSVVSISKTKGSYTKAKGKKAGTAYVTAKYGKYKAKAKIVVKKANKKVTGVSVTGTAKVGETLTAAVTPSGATVKYQWYAGDTAISGATAKTYTVLGKDVVGKTITCKVTGTGAYAGSKTSTATTAVKATEITNVVIAMPTKAQGTTPYVGDELEATIVPAGAKATYQWYAGGYAISGATSAKYTVASTDAGKTLTVKVTGTDGFTGTDVTSTVTDAVKVSLANSAKATISNNDTTKTTIVAGDKAKVTVTDKDGKALTGNTYTYQWYQDSYDATAPTKNAIASAESETYSVKGTDAGHKLICVVTGKEGATGTVVSDATATITDTLATVTISGTAKVGQELTATLASTNVATAKDITATYQWYRGVTPISSATSAKYVATSDDYNQAISCQAVGTGNFSGTKLSAASTIEPGEYTAAVQVGGSAVTAAALGDTLTAVTNPTTIPSGDVTYQWYQSSDKDTGYTAITGATSATYAPTATNYYKCIVTTVTAKVTSGVYKTAQVQTDAVQVGKKITSVGLTESPAGTYTAKAEPSTGTGAIAEGDVEYTWYLDNTAAANQLGTYEAPTFTAATGATYKLDVTKAYVKTTDPTAVTSFAGHKLICVATGKANYIGSTAKVSTSTIKGAIEAGTNTTFTDPKVGTEIVITKDYCKQKNSDNKFDVYTIQWYRDGNAISGATGYKYTPTSADYNHVITVKLTGTGDYSGEVEVKAATPGATVAAATLSASLNKTTAQAGVDTLTVTTTPKDAAVSYQWYKLDTAGNTEVPAAATSYTGFSKISGATAASYALTSADAGYTIFCEVTPTNVAYGTTSYTYGITGNNIVL